VLPGPKGEGEGRNPKARLTAEIVFTVTALWVEGRTYLKKKSGRKNCPLAQITQGGKKWSTALPHSGCWKTEYGVKRKLERRFKQNRFRVRRKRGLTRLGGREEK